jgi:hypothetical protein
MHADGWDQQRWECSFGEGLIDNRTAAAWADGLASCGRGRRSLAGEAMIKNDLVTLPAAYASAFVKGDYTGLDRRDAENARALIGLLAEHGWSIIDVAYDANGEPCGPRLTWSYRLYGGLYLGGEVLDYVAHRSRR